MPLQEVRDEALRLLFGRTAFLGEAGEKLAFEVLELEALRRTFRVLLRRTGRSRPGHLGAAQFRELVAPFL